MYRIVTIIVMFVTFISVAAEMSSKDFSIAVSTAVDEIKKHEGFRSTWYDCPSGKMKVIGYGCPKQYWNKPSITKVQAEELLTDRCQALGKEVLAMTHVKLNTNQLAALISFVYNVGLTNFEESTLLRNLNNGNYNKVPSEMKRWVYSNKRKLNGLVTRRSSEALLFMK